MTTEVNWTNLGGGKGNELWDRIFDHLEVRDIKALNIAHRSFHSFHTQYYRPSNTPLAQNVKDLTWFASQRQRRKKLAVVVIDSSWEDLFNKSKGKLISRVLKLLCRFELRRVDLKGLSEIKLNDLDVLNPKFLHHIETYNGVVICKDNKNKTALELEMRDVASLDMIESRVNLSTIESIRLINSSLDDHAIDLLFKKAPKLAEFSLTEEDTGRDNSKLTYESLQNLKQYAAQLRVLKIDNVSLSAKELYNILLPLTSLEELSIEELPMNDNALEKLVAKMPRLSRINLNHTQVTAAGVEKLALSHTGLISLGLRGITGEDNLISEALLCLKQLKCIDLGLSWISINAIERLQALPNLVELNLYAAGLRNYEDRIKQLFPNSLINL